MKNKSKNNARMRAKQFILIGGILIILSLMSSANWAMLPGNSSSTNLALPNVTDSQIPTLNPITPSSNLNGYISLSWSDVSGAQFYKVYRSTSPITEADITGGLGPCGSNVDPTYIDDMVPNGTYYYVVTAVDGNYGESSCSNCESVTVAVTAPTAPILNAFSPNPSNSGLITVCWSDVNNAYYYQIYRSTSPITSGNFASLTPVGAVWEPQIAWGDNITTNGTYYYAVRVSNEAGENLSNCESVQIAISPVPTNTYVGVKPGDSFLYNYSMQTPGYSDIGLMVLTVDNITDLNFSAEIGYHEALSNSTTTITLYGNETIGAFDSSTSIFSFLFINKNISDKTIYYNNPQSGETLSDTWDNNGVLLTYSDIVSGNSTIFNRIPPNAPTHLTVTPNPSTNGNDTLQWDASNYATSYELYRYTSPITEINSSLTLVVTTYMTTYNDILNQNGTFYYVVVASNSAGDSAISNCASVTVTVTTNNSNNSNNSPNSKNIPGFPLGILLASSAFGVIILFLKKKSKIITT